MLTVVLVATLSCPAPVPAFRDAVPEIDRDVWIPFLAASSGFDADAFLALQSEDLVRVAPDTREVYGLSRYRTEIREGFQRARERGTTRSTEMRFLVRTSSGELAYETGYFRSEVTLATGEVRVRYARFEMVLRKEDGKWKILLDKDTADDGAIDEAAFRAAAPIK